MRSILSIYFITFFSLPSFSQEVPAIDESAIIKTDQSYYAAGDRITYHAFIFPDQPGADSLKFISHFLYVDFVHPDGTIIQHQKLKLTKGVGKGDFTTNINWDQGYYRIFAYTASMVNEKNEDIFSIEIPLYNPASAHDLENIDIPGKAAFFPEGGILLAGKSNKVLYYLDDEMSLSKGKLSLVDKEKNLILDISKVQKIGTLEFIPEPNQSYYLSTGEKTFALPIVSDSGVIIKTDEEPGSFTIRVLSTKMPFNRASLKAISNGNEVYSTVIDLQSELPTTIKKADLPEGLINIVLVNNGRTYSERLIANNQKLPKVDISLEKDTFDKGERVTASVMISDAIGNPLESVISASVIHKEPAAIKTHPHEYDPDVLKQDMMSKLNVRFDQDQIKLMDYLITCKYMYQEETPGLPERIQKINLDIDPSSPGKSEDLTFIAAYFLEEEIYAETRYESGNAVLYLPDLEMQNNVWLAGFDSKGNYLGEIHTLNKRSRNKSRTYESIEKPLVINGNEIIKYLNRKLKNDAVRKVYGVPVTPEFEDNPYEPEIRIVPGDYIEESDFRSFIIGIIPKASVKKKRGVENIYLSPSHTSSRFKSPPLYFINNIPTYDGSILLSLDLSDIEHVEVFNSFKSMGRFGISGRNGIFKVFLKEESINPISDHLDKYMVVGGLSFSTFASEGFAKPEDMNYPDFRTLLKTSQPLESDVHGKVIFNFNTSDITGDYSIIIKGVTEDGYFLSGEKLFTVESKEQTSN